MYEIHSEISYVGLPIMKNWNQMWYHFEHHNLFWNETVLYRVPLYLHIMVFTPLLLNGFISASNPQYKKFWHLEER